MALFFHKLTKNMVPVNNMGPSKKEPACKYVNAFQVKALPERLLPEQPEGQRCSSIGPTNTNTTKDKFISVPTNADLRPLD